MVNRRELQRIPPSALPLDNALMVEAVVDLIHHVLPSLSHKYLRKFIHHEHVRTLVLLIPEELISDAQAKNDTSSSGEGEDNDDEKPKAGDEKEVAAAAPSAAESDDEGDDETSSDDDADAPPKPVGLDPAARELMKRRLAGAVCYEVGERLGERLIQVSLLGVRIRYQRLGVASR